MDEYKRQYIREKVRKYREKHKERCKETEVRKRIRNRVKIRQQYRNWLARHREEDNAMHRQWRKENKSKYKKYKERNSRKQRIENELEYNKMHISEKINMGLDKLIQEMESANLIGALDLTYLKQVKPRLEACRIISQKWKEEFNIMHRGIK